MKAPISVVDLLRNQDLHVRDVYADACTFHRGELKKARRGMLFMYGWIVLSTGVLLFVLFTAFQGDDEQSSFTVLAGLVILQIVVIIAGLVYSFIRRSGAYIFRNPRLQPLNLTDVPNFRTAAMDVAHRFNIPVKRIRWWREISLATSASILKTEQLVHIIIPLPLIVRATRDPDGTRALLAHEFAHWAHNDSELIVWAESFANYFTFVFAINAGLILIGWIVSGFKGMDWHSLVPWYFANQACEKMLLARRKTEFLADMRAAVEYGAVTYMRVLNETVRDDGSEKSKLDEGLAGGDQRHPQKTLRLVRVALLWGHPGMSQDPIPPQFEQFYQSVSEAYKLDEGRSSITATH